MNQRNYKKENQILLNDIKRFLMKQAYVPPPSPQNPNMMGMDPNMPIDPAVMNQFMMQGGNPNMQGMDPNMMDPNMMQGMDPNMMDPNMMQGMDPNMMDPNMMQGMDPNMMDPNMMQEMPPKEGKSVRNSEILMELENTKQNLDFVNQKLDIILNLLTGGGQPQQQPTTMAPPMPEPNMQQSMPPKYSKEYKKYLKMMQNLMR